jgi:hypothetical protein
MLLLAMLKVRFEIFASVAVVVLVLACWTMTRVARQLYHSIRKKQNPK